VKGGCDVCGERSVYYRRERGEVGEQGGRFLNRLRVATNVKKAQGSE
jgi:hypothetical protein